MKKHIYKVIFYLQSVLVHISYCLFNIFNARKREGWVVIAVETASMLKNISNALSGSVSVNFAPNKFYSDYKYDYEIYSNSFIFKVINIIYAPLIFGYLLNRHDRFIYLGESGFLTPFDTGRDNEFRILKAKNKRIICFFMGSEIRSFKLLEDFSKKKNMDVITTYQPISHIGIDSPELENARRRLAESADKYADEIINPAIDQMSYIKRLTYPFIYFLSDDLFYSSLSKFDQMDEIRVVHGPSSPIIKGTPLVRAAIKKLELEGYKFKYIELINVPHQTMLRELQSAHIVLNEFYAFVPGVFGLEAMASHCALLTSADENIETTLPHGANSAWSVTPYWSIYDNLKKFLDKPELIKSQAIVGYNWAKKNYQYKSAVKKLNEIIND
ncbi:glycosyltransferase [Vibrio metschnikovii]|uniref:glycosyltransferase n=1 Tax=Vibrio metschnikovii TaxID=28172 RepID=UPI001C2F8E54|nr:hypothetical protein [Vibrio metschnikovii]